MITKKELSAIYRNDYFMEGTGEISIKETNLTNPNSDLKSLKLTGIDGKYLQISPQWLKDSNEPYNAKFNQLKLFRRDCDSIILMNHKGVQYALWLELKSGFDSATKEAMFQLVGSYIRSKTYLNAFSDFVSDHFVELAVVVGHPKKDDDISASGNDMVLGVKRQHTPKNATSIESLVTKYRRKLLTKNITNLVAADFEVDRMPFAPSVTFDKLPFVHIVTEGQDCKMSIDDILKNLEELK